VVAQVDGWLSRENDLNSPVNRSPVSMLHAGRVNAHSAFDTRAISCFRRSEGTGCLTIMKCVQVVGRCEEVAKVTESSSVPQVVVDVRHADKGPLKGRHPAIQPERVIHHNRRVRLQWGQQEGLDDVMLMDLSFLTHHMQPPMESHARLWKAGNGQFGVEKAACARVYHLHFIVAVKSLAKGDSNRAMALRHVRVVMDRNGIKRLEADESMGLRKPLRPFTRAVARLSTLPTLQLRRSASQPGSLAAISGAPSAPSTPRSGTVTPHGAHSRAGATSATFDSSGDGADKQAAVVQQGVNSGRGGSERDLQSLPSRSNWEDRGSPPPDPRLKGNPRSNGSPRKHKQPAVPGPDRL